MRLTTKTLYGTRALPDLAIHQKGNSEYCAARDIRGDVKQAVDRALVATTLQDLAERQTSQGPLPICTLSKSIVEAKKK